MRINRSTSRADRMLQRAAAGAGMARRALRRTLRPMRSRSRSRVPRMLRRS
jgi:hypothetical protein